MLCDSENGYVYNFDYYEGKRDRMPCQYLGESVVLKLLDGLSHRGHHVFMDNFYTSVQLFKELEKRQIGASGTLRENRKDLPMSIRKPGKTKRGDLKCYLSGNLLSFLWKDKRDVRFLTNVTGGISSITRWTKQGQDIIQRPDVISLYTVFILKFETSKI